MVEIILGLLVCPILAVLLGNAFWNWGAYSRLSGYHPRTKESYEAAARDLNKAVR